MADDVKLRCHGYLIELLKKMRQRFPSNLRQLESLTDLSPSVVFGTRNPMLSQLSFNLATLCIEHKSGIT